MIRPAADPGKIPRPLAEQVGERSTSAGSGDVNRTMRTATGDLPVISVAREGTHCGQLTNMESQRSPPPPIGPGSACGHQACHRTRGRERCDRPESRKRMLGDPAAQGRLHHGQKAGEGHGDRPRPPRTPRPTARHQPPTGTEWTAA